MRARRIIEDKEDIIKALWIDSATREWNLWKQLEDLNIE